MNAASTQKGQAMDFETAILTITEAAKLQGAAQWTQGDAAADVTPVYGEETIAKLAEASGVDSHRLQHYRWVASRFERSVRTDLLSWTHHERLASRDDRLVWLEQAAQNGWSVRVMMDAVYARDYQAIRTRNQAIRAQSSADAREAIETQLQMEHVPTTRVVGYAKHGTYGKIRQSVLRKLVAKHRPDDVGLVETVSPFFGVFDGPTVFMSPADAELLSKTAWVDYLLRRRDELTDLQPREVAAAWVRREKPSSYQSTMEQLRVMVAWLSDVIAESEYVDIPAAESAAV
jgi:hypothetical protein